jgi:monofunctional biosynthetic peptidoglycan transglycosylase
MSDQPGDDLEQISPEKPAWEEPAIETFEPEDAPDELDAEELPPPPPARAWTPVQVTPPRDWPPAAVPSPMGPPLGDRPLPELTRIEPAKPAKTRRPLLVRLAILLLKAILIFVIGSVLWVAVYRFIAPPVTLTMIGDAIGGNGVTRQWMPLSRIDPSMARAAIAAEDSRFCQHHGFDFEAIEKAYARNATGKKHIRGGSTISQQTAKNVFLWQGGGYFRKGLEAWFTVLIENIWGKRRIMEVYLNVAETGIGTYGVNAGAMRYYRHDASHLSAVEAARIAAVLPLPKKREAVDPGGFTRRYGNAITARIGVVRGDGLDACLR